VSPDKKGTVTIIANYIPLEAPAGGPNFFEFGDDVLYTINIDNDGDGQADIVYKFQFTTTVANPNIVAFPDVSLPAHVAGGSVTLTVNEAGLKVSQPVPPW